MVHTPCEFPFSYPFTNVISNCYLIVHLKGEPVNKWSLEEFRMYEGGPLWRPPPINFFTNGMPEELVEPADYPFAPGYHAGRSDDAVE